MALNPLYIFDLDGTIANIDHRRHLVAHKKKQRWDDFYLACVDDKPNEPVCRIFRDLHTTIDNDVYIWSGRSDTVLQETVEWLETYLTPYLPRRDIYKMLTMRPHGDSTPDDILKKKWYDELSQENKDRLVCVFDDRQKVVDMWRSIGVTCLQVAKGDF